MVCFDVANALYMVLFDAFATGTPQAYKTFRPSFLAGYLAAPGSSLQEGTLDLFIDLRVQALRAWLNDPDSAPIGIRDASLCWRATLRAFVTGYSTMTS